MKRPALAGVRVVEQGQLLAVPYAARLLADLGAEIVKIESPLRLDAHRQTTYPDNEPGLRFWDRGGTYYSENRGKLSITLNLRQPVAVEVFRDLVRVSDVVMENFTPRVMRAFGLDYPQLVKIRPELVMLSSTGYGHTGPWSNYAAVGPTTESASGLAAVSGYRGGAPLIPDIPYTDYVAAEHAVLAVLLALLRRKRTGMGAYIDLAQTEAQSALAGELLAQAGAGAGQTEPHGNRHPAMAPHGFFPCAGTDRWIAIAVSSEAEWDALRAAMGRPAWAEEGKFATLTGRKRDEDQLEERLSAWTRTGEAMQLMRILQERGVPAGVALDGRDLVCNDHLRARGFFTWLEHPPETGIGPKPFPGVPWRFSESRSGTSRRAPALGEHTDWVLRELLGYDDLQITGLHACGALDAHVESFRRPQPVPLQELQRQGRIREIDRDYERRIGPG